MTIDPPSAGEITRSEAVAARLGEPTAARPTPVWAALLFTFVANLTAGVVTIGIFFVADTGFGFGPRRNLLLGLLMGATYIVGALGVGPALRRASASPKVEWITARLVIAFLLVVMGGCSASLALAHEGALGARAAWVIWPAIAVCSMAMGGLWPIVESYVTGGRRGDDLRRVVGRFNVTWSVGTVLTAWLMAPALQTASAALLLMLFTGIAQVLTCGLLVFFSPYPAREAHEHHPHPPVYDRLLAVFRVLLPTSYLLMYTLTPLIPSVLGGMSIEAEHRTLVFSVFLLARVVSFGVFGRWSGWHGKWGTPVWTTVLMLAGFALTLLASNVAVACAGLALFGLGLGGIYTGALYYVMEVGASEVEAGGTHEALIGGGYTLGPVIGLAGLWAVQRSGETSSLTAEQATAALAVVVALIAAALAFRAGRVRASPSGGIPGSSAK